MFSYETQAARPEDVFIMPGEAAPAKGAGGKTLRRAIRAARTAGVAACLCLTFAASAFSANDLYISGGGAGYSSGVGANGGPFAGHGGNSSTPGGGAYVGFDGNETISNAAGGIFNTAGVVESAVSSLIGSGWTATANNGGSSIGGAASLTVNGDLMGTNTVSITGGNASSDAGGAGGAASLTVSGTLRTNALSLVKGNDNGARRGGHASATIGRLDATGGAMTLTLNGTAAGEVVFHTLDLGGGHTFEVIRQSGGVYDPADTYNIRGQATYDDLNGTFNADGKIMNFYVPGGTANGTTMLRVTGDANIANSTVNVGIEGTSSPLAAGDSLILIDSGGTLTGDPANSTSDGSGMQGVTLKYEFDLLTQGNQLLAKVTKADTNERTKALSEGFISGIGLLNQGADLVAGSGLENALRSTAQARVSTGYGLAVFGALSGGRSRYNTGSHVDVSGVSLMVGLAGGTDLAPGHLTVGGFFEYGNGSYDTYNSFSTAASVKGDGTIHHAGGGVLGRMDFKDTGPGHIYAEASARVGSVHNDYSNSDLRDSQGRKASYDSSSMYYGLHLGAGYLWNINGKASLDLYGKYFWTRQNGDSVTLSTGDPVQFKDVDSHRVRLGTRAACTVNEYIAPYLGAAWEHEFDGKARASTNGFAIDAPSLRGDTGIGELGVVLKPSRTLPLSIDVGVHGYVGRREGVTGLLQIKYEF